MSLINLPKMPKQPKVFFTPSGKKTKAVYKYVYDEKYGCPRRVKTGEMDLDAFIQEGRDNVDFATLGKILVDTKANIIDHFISQDGQVIDVTGQPRNIHEATKMMADLQDSFASLPSDLKALFDNDFDTFRSSYKAGTFGAKIESYYKSLETVDASKDGE